MGGKGVWEGGREGSVGRWEEREGGKVGGKEGRQEGGKDSFFVCVRGGVMVVLTVHSEEGGVIGGGACLVRR